ncbi:hypothetical protein Tco_1009141, partial [Tanacetum coccineum]
TWDDIMVMMGDFNEVRKAGERYDSVFNDRVVLEKGIPDHRHILLKESQVDYGSTLFQFFHSWMEMEGFQNLVVETWNNEAIVNANGLRDHQKWLSSIDVKIDHGNASEEDFKNRCNSSFIALIPKVSNANSVFDFRPISLIGCQYKFIDKLLANRLSIVIENCISPMQSAFIKGRNILDGPLISNEVMVWYRQRKKELMVFKVASIGRYNLSICHLMHADDVIFFGEWSWVNAHNLISMTRCFFLISGFKINVHKSNVLGVGVTDEEVSHMVNIIGFGATKLPLKYLGVLVVGGRLSLIKSVLGNLPTFYMSIYLMPVSIRKKLKSLHNKFFTRGDLDDKNMTRVKWKRSIASKKDGGLGIDNIFGLNIGILFKWIWSCLSSFFGRLSYFGYGYLKLSVGNRILAIKVNVFLWRLKLNKLPYRVNLDRRGIEVNWVGVDYLVCDNI